MVWHYIALGKPTRNTFVESLNGNFRDGLFHEFLFSSLAEVREKVIDWKEYYNRNRPDTRPSHAARTLTEIETGN
ncbi:integrase core domain-containing protein [Flavimaricola marinus]|uniref:Integrase catalytic domain-containing protein n=1 Tax=Flavimaricola marinus TaxID=1819565 RepID=A0A238LL50_9RHOB|nr:hypothetical protein LOM8899_04592 [Flavimaricola marinus]